MVHKELKSVIRSFYTEVKQKNFSFNLLSVLKGLENVDKLTNKHGCISNLATIKFHPYCNQFEPLIKSIKSIIKECHV